MSETLKPGAVIFAKHVVRLVRFYEALVPMTIVGTDHGAVILESDTLQLVIHPIPRAIAAQIDIAAPPVPRSDSAVKLVFAVDSLARVREQAAGFDGSLKDAAAEFVARGFRACDGHDPEGNIVQFRVAEAASAFSSAG